MTLARAMDVQIINVYLTLSVTFLWGNILKINEFFSLKTHLGMLHIKYFNQEDSLVKFILALKFRGVLELVEHLKLLVGYLVLAKMHFIKGD